MWKGWFLCLAVPVFIFYFIYFSTSPSIKEPDLMEPQHLKVCTGIHLFIDYRYGLYEKQENCNKQKQ
jgi:hypothetical protein